MNPFNPDRPRPASQAQTTRLAYNFVVVAMHEAHSQAGAAAPAPSLEALYAAALREVHPTLCEMAGGNFEPEPEFEQICVNMFKSVGMARAELLPPR